MINKETFPKLQNLFGAYFHQDWKEVFNWSGHEPNFVEVIRFYKSAHPPYTSLETAQQLRKFLALKLSEARLKEALWMAYFNPNNRGMTYGQWLEKILEILEDPAQNSTYLKEIQQKSWTGWEEYAE